MLLRLAHRYLMYPWRRRNQPLVLERPGTATDIPSTSPHAAQRLGAVARELAACGFVAGAHFREEFADSPSKDRQAYLSIWLNDRDAVVARAIWARFAEPAVRYELTSFALSFTTTFADGRDVITTNAPTASTFPPDPASDVLGWRDMNHPAMLYKLHRARAAQLRGGRATVMPAATPEGMDALMRDTERRVIERAIQRGYLRRGAGGQLRSTLRGSYLMTWRILWPWKHVTMARHARKLRRALADFPDLAAEARALPPSEPAMYEQIGWV
jgi:hypothetical protein